MSSQNKDFSSSCPALIEILCFQVGYGDTHLDQHFVTGNTQIGIVQNFVNMTFNSKILFLMN